MVVWCDRRTRSDRAIGSSPRWSMASLPAPSTKPAPKRGSRVGAMAKKESEVGYAEALAELERILSELEAADVDVDVLAEKVARASELIRLCRDRIGNAKLQIDKVVAGLED
ncbi:MAG: exodeoxyribonuclease VII small subunit [Acidimicrobiales bacterium mtb01]|nr:exodeoxyribonuclease VII small subunit [Actinomycetota bacterium]TEX46717.1 MAG: exodeoxyribonuclease VII small subunit [Acidimicrobiales bacterium mtb01]